MQITRIVLFVSLLGIICSCGETAEQKQPIEKKEKIAVTIPEGWKTTSGKEFSISYPEDWTADQSGQMGTKLFLFAPQEDANDKFNENINLMTEDLPSNSIDLDTYVEASEKQIKKYIDDAEIISSKRVTLNGKDFQNVSYTGSQSNLSLKFNQFYTIQDGKAYILTFTCKEDTYDKYDGLGTKIMNTFELL